MSVAYEHRNFIHEDAYPNIGDPSDVDPTGDVHRFSDATDAIVNELNNAAAVYGQTAALLADTNARLDLTASEPSPKADSVTDPSSPPHRIKAIPKPDRKVTKNVEGKFECTWPNCTEDVKLFKRKCEWSKHMDKHDRPYKCTAEGCEKLPGFTYSGGLLRHEREVHNKHGGPKTTHNCPFANCKRHTGKGFSRMENLNEHMRRVHTSGGSALGGLGGIGSNSDDSDAGSTGGGATVGLKRKRLNADEGVPSAAGLSGSDDKSADEVKRLRQENAELHRQIEGLNHQTVIMMQQIGSLQSALEVARMAPAPDML